MNKKSGLTLEEHRMLGRELIEIRESLGKHAARLLTRYAKGSKVTSRLARTLRDLVSLQSALDNRLAVEHPDVPDLKRIYYE